MRQHEPALLIVGAGPGDPELITTKGLNAIRGANVILYDALVSPDLIKNAPPHCKLVFVGKRRGRKAFTQQEINRLLVFYAARYEHVVRLKGGDPFVFGRGHEEKEFAMKHGVRVGVIPGISSSYAAPSSAGIPITSRGVSESFWVVTGTVSSGEISKDLNIAAASSATIIVLMGLSHLAEVANIISMNRGVGEPMAVIQHASLPTQKVVVGTAKNIHAVSMNENISSPAVIIVGKVVDLRTVINSHQEIFEEVYAKGRAI